jgi:hypothetical protein
MTLASFAAAQGNPVEEQKSVRTQASESDFDFLARIAKANAWDMFIDHTQEPKGYVLRFQFLMQDYAPSVSLEWGKSLMDFTPRITTVGDVFGVAARVWIASIQTEFVIVVSWDYDRACFNLQIYPDLGDLNFILGEATKETISIKPTSFPNVLHEILIELLPRLNNRLTGTGNTIGNPAIKRHTGTQGARRSGARARAIDRMKFERTVLRSKEHVVESAGMGHRCFTA